METDLQQMRDEELIALSGAHPSAFSEIVNRYQEPFLKKARSILGAREEVHDVVQDAFTKIYLNGGRFKEVEGASFKSWAYRIVVNTTLTEYQKLKKQHERFVVPEEEIYNQLPEKETILETNERSFFEKEIVAVCSKMPRNLARMFQLYFVKGESHAKIARDEGLTEGAVKTRISRAKKEFKKIVLDSNPVF